MHCRCDGCTPKVSSALNNLALAPGVVAVLERSATEDTEEVRLLATADPERLRKSLHEATGKKKAVLLSGRLVTIMHITPHCIEMHSKIHILTFIHGLPRATLATDKP
ncbi:hypothetical protein CFC21_085368 [Triticum aestivum]|uniref:HMA domain-containing protein n=2 Tax=Triticum aestivum TaxID=4565 RepID=A0A9R1L8D0_WHEAT|nr:hypothetical protein CFC21_085368 [Triticum aestivum]